MRATPSSYLRTSLRIGCSVAVAKLDARCVERWRHARDPWSQIESNGGPYGRGVVNNKYRLTTLAQAFLRLRREGFIPDRELVLPFSGDEETGMVSTRLMADRVRGAAFAFNSDAVGGYRPSAAGSPSYYIHAAEKTYATFELTARNKGGHSSSPRTHNAIYQLSAALLKVAAHRFPVRWDPISLAALANGADDVNDDIALSKAVSAFVTSPGDPDAVRRMGQKDWLDRDLRSTCMATMLQPGIAENVLRTAAKATINCRIFPRESIEETKTALARVAGDQSLELAVLGCPWRDRFRQYRTTSPRRL